MRGSSSSGSSSPPRHLKRATNKRVAITLMLGLACITSYPGYGPLVVTTLRGYMVLPRSRAHPCVIHPATYHLNPLLQPPAHMHAILSSHHHEDLGTCTVQQKQQCKADTTSRLTLPPTPILHASRL